MKTVHFFLATLVLISFFFACQPTESEIIPNPNVKFPADTVEEFFKLIDNPDVKMIRSHGDLDDARKVSGSVYAKLDNDTFKAFKNELKFKNNALSTARVNVIKDILSEEDYIAFWSGFGISDNFAADYEGYECFNTGDCKTATGHICTSNC